jgi:hypothetical protein
MLDVPYAITGPACPHDQFDTDAATLARTADTVLDQLRYLATLHGCPDVSWSWNSDYPDHQLTLSGITGTARPRAARRAAEQWANALGLTASPRAMAGTVEYAGDINGLRMRVWAVVDRHQFDNRSTLHLYGPELALGGLMVLAAAAAVLAARGGALAKLAMAVTR